MTAAAAAAHNATASMPRAEGIAAWSAVPLSGAVAMLAVELVGWVAWAFGVNWVHAGWVPLTPAAVAGLVAMWCWRDVNSDGRGGVAPVAWALGAFCTAVIIAASTLVGPVVAAGLVASAAGEEAVFRVALPAVIVAGLVAANVRVPLANVCAFAVAAFAFAYMPGHLAQADGGGQLPWFALATMWTLMLWWRMPLWVPWLSHAAMNASAAVMGEGGSPLWWVITLFVPMVALVINTVIVDRREGRRRRNAAGCDRSRWQLPWRRNDLAGEGSVPLS